jgi:hypothetical protein
MAHVKTIRILVVGLAAFVEGPPGEIQVLLPRVDARHWLEKHNLYIPDHHGLLGYIATQSLSPVSSWEPDCKAYCSNYCAARCSQDLYCVDRCKEGCVGRNGTCWRRLLGTEVYFPQLEVTPPEADSSERGRRFMGFGEPTALPRSPDEIRDFSWVADMGRITGVATAVETGVLGGDQDYDVEARASLSYTRRSVCRLAGHFDRATKRFVVPVYGFRGSPSVGEGAGYRQALATATVLEIDLQTPLPRLEVCLRPIAGGEPDCSLRLEADNDEGIVFLAMAHQVPDGHALLHAVRQALGQAHHEVDDHFRAFHHLYRSHVAGVGAVPFEVGPSISFDQKDLDKACKSPFLLPLDTPIDLLDNEKHQVAKIEEAARAIYLNSQDAGQGASLVELVWLLSRWAPTNVPVTAPDGYLWSSILGPPLCPQVVFKGGS